MDIVSHALWTNAIYIKTKRRARWWTVVFALLPDFIPFGPFFFEELAVHNVRGAATQFSAEAIRYVTTAYHLTHSLIVFAAVFGIVWILRRGKSWWPLTAWGLHIIMDIPTHSRAFFPTPFLYPISDYTVNAISWAHPYFFFPNLAALAVTYLIMVVLHRRRRIAQIDRT